MAGRSVINLTCFMNIAVPIVSNRSQLDIIYCDLSKAFDLVDHNLLFYEVQRMGVRASMLAWFSCYEVTRKELELRVCTLIDITTLLVPPGIGSGTPIVYIVCQ